MNEVIFINDYMKTLLSKFFLSSVIIMCLTMVAVGFVTVTQKSEQMMNANDYAVVAVNSINEKLEITVDEKSFDFDLSVFEDISEFSKQILLTPISCITYFIEVIIDLIR